MACPGIRRRLGPLLAAGAAEPVSLCFEHGVQGLLDRAAHHLAQMIPDPGLTDLDHLTHRLGSCLLVHLLLLSASVKGAAGISKCAKLSVRYRIAPQPPEAG